MGCSTVLTLPSTARSSPQARERAGVGTLDHYRDAFFALVPAPARATLEIGSGEGRVARDLAGRGHRVTGVDLTPALARLAAEAAGGCPGQKPHRSDFSCLRRTVRERDLRWRLGRL